MNLGETADLLIHLRLKDDATGALKGVKGGAQDAEGAFRDLQASVSSVNPTLGKLFGLAQPGFRSLGQTTQVAGGAITELGQATKVAGGYIQALPAPLSAAAINAASFKQSMLPMAGVVAGAATAGIALGEAIKGVGEAIGSSIGAAAQEEQNIARMGAALKANVTSWNGDTTAIELNIKQREALAFSDDDLRNSMAQLTFVTHNVGKALDAQRVAMDLARGKSLDLNTASVIVGKVLGGNVSILKRYGIAIGDIHDPLQALALLEKTFAGQSEAYAKTLQGQMESATIAIKDADEAFGKHLLPTAGKVVTAINTGVIPAVANLTDNLGSLAALLTRTPTGVDEARLFTWIPQALVDTYPGLRTAVDGAKKTITDEFLRNSGPVFNLDHLNIEYTSGSESPLVQAVTKAYYAALGIAGHEIERNASSPLAVAMKAAYKTAEASAAHDIERESSPPLIRAMKVAFDAAAASAQHDIERDPVWANLGKGIPDAIAQGMLNNEDALTTAASALKDVLQNGLSPNEQKVQAEGAHWIRLLTRGFNSNKIGAEAATEQLAGDLINTIEDAAHGTPNSKDLRAIGKIWDTMLASGLTEAQALQILKNAGVDTSAAWVQGLLAPAPTTKRKKAGGQMATDTHAGIESKAWEQWGAGAAKRWEAGFSDGVRRWEPPMPRASGGGGSGGTRVRALGGPVTGGTAYIVGERRPELFIPKTNGYILPQLPPTASPVALASRWQGMMGPPGQMQQPIVNITVIISAREVSQELKREYDLTNRRTR